MKKLVIKELTNEQGVVDKIQIVEQPGVRNSFSKKMTQHGSNFFSFDGFSLVSISVPAIMGSHRFSEFKCNSGLFVRGDCSGDDYRIMKVPSQEWLNKMRVAVRAYNKQLGSCDDCTERHCNSCEFKEKQ